MACCRVLHAPSVARVHEKLNLASRISSSHLPLSKPSRCASLSHCRDPKNYFHIPPAAYPGPTDPVFLPGPSYMLSGPLLLALTAAFPVAPQAVLDPWRGFEDKFLGAQVELLARGAGLPVRVVGRYEHYSDVARSAELDGKSAFCDPLGWATKLAVQVIGYNESHPLPQFSCPGWSWPTGGGDLEPK